MKNALIVLLIVLFVSVPLASCSVAPSDGTDVTAGTAEESGGTGETEEMIYVKYSSLYLAPDLDLLFESSDLIVKGAVVRMTEKRLTNPDGKFVNKNGESVPKGTLYRYEVTVTESYRGDIVPGESVTVDVFTHMTDDVPPNVVVIGAPDLVEFSDGQEALLFLCRDDWFVRQDEAVSYTIVHDGWGVFTEEEDGKFRSPVYEVDEEIIREKISEKG